MPLTLEKRVEELERKVSKLAMKPHSPSKKNWRKTFGFSREDEGFMEMVRRGQEYRRGLSKNGRADS
jgi:hypothetical protein